VVASAVGGLTELIRDGREGFLVPPGSPGELGRAIRTLAGSAALRTEMGRRAFDRAREYGRDRMAAAYASIYREDRREER